MTFWVEECCCDWGCCSDWNEDDWKSIWTEGKFDLGAWDGGDNLIHQHDNNCDDCGDSTSYNVSIIDSGKLMFPFSISCMWSLK